ncbi:MAG: type II secretion system minor pseudopilin GspK [Burkholderiaceae bacterium]
MTRRPRPQRGAALLLAMLIVTLVATLAAGMVWQQWKGIEVEGAERARAQASWLIEGATDWARLILRTDAQDREHPGVDTLNEPWNTPLKDVKLSDFLAADKNNTADSGLDAFLSGQITDAQSRFNLRNLLNDDDEEAAAALAVLKRLCESLGLPPETATRIADGMKGAELAEDQLSDEEAVAPGAPLPPQRVQQLTWFGLDADAVRRLAPYVVILPAPNTTVNLLTAPPEVLTAVLEGLDRGTAERFAQKRLTVDVRTIADVKPLLPDKVAKTLDANNKLVGVQSFFFEILGELRYESFVLRELTMVQRRGQEVVVIRRERLPHE